jgi:peptide/nickel transport system substrate-binding protein
MADRERAFRFAPWIGAATLGLTTMLACMQSRSRGEVSGEVGWPKDGGVLVTALRSEPKSLNPVLANDASSREVLNQLNADLLHINRRTQAIEPSLAESWSVSRDQCRYILRLRHNLNFSDGELFDADDVVFSFRLYMDKGLNAPQRESLMVAGRSIGVQKLDKYTVEFSLPRPYASAERLFDSIAILPRHLLEGPYLRGSLSHTWALNTPKNQVAGLGPFRIRQYSPGVRLTIERNPYFWKKDAKEKHLPFLAGITFLFVGNADAEVLRLEAGQTDVINRLSVANYMAMKTNHGVTGICLYDLGPSLDYNFFFFNLNRTLPTQDGGLHERQKWFEDARFRQAVSSAIDRENIIRIIFQGRGTALWTNVSPANTEWYDPSLPHLASSIERSQALLRASGFSWRSNDGILLDQRGSEVAFSIIVGMANDERIGMATLIQQDLRKIGILSRVIPLEFNSLLDRVFQTHDYDAAILGLGGADSDPNSQMNVLLSSGNDHLWNLNQPMPDTAWEADIDRLMTQQMFTSKKDVRKQLYSEVQQIEIDELPLIFLNTPNVLVAARATIGNFQPTILDPHTLWNSDQLYLNRRTEEFGDGAREDCK